MLAAIVTLVQNEKGVGMLFASISFEGHTINRFSKNTLAQEAGQDMKDGLREKLISVLNDCAGSGKGLD